MVVNALLGKFPFSIPTAMFQSLDRSTAQRWSSHERVGQRAAYQNLGAGDDEISIPGYIMPGYTGAMSVYSMDTLRAMMAMGKPYTLIKLSLNGLVGDLRGKWIILDITENQSEFFGASPQRIDFTLKLRRVDEEKSLAGKVLNALL